MNEQRKVYPSNLSDGEWAHLEALIPTVKSGGGPVKYERREVVNAILYVLRTGSSWRMLPHDLPPWQSVYGYFRRWCQAGVWHRVHQHLREQWRMAVGRNPCPSAQRWIVNRSKRPKKGATRLGWAQTCERTQTSSAGGQSGVGAGRAY